MLNRSWFQFFFKWGQLGNLKYELLNKIRITVSKCYNGIMIMQKSHTEFHRTRATKNTTVN